MTASDFQEKLDFSRQYEVAFSQWLQAARGYFTLPMYDFSGKSGDKAPVLACGTHKLIAPDIMAFKDNALAWFEIKVKDKATLYRKTNTLVTGLPLHHYQHYQAVKRLTTSPVWLVFIHLAEQEIVSCEIDTVQPNHTYQGNKMSRSGMAFFAYDDLSHITLLSSLDKFLPEKGA